MIPLLYLRIIKKSFIKFLGACRAKGVLGLGLIAHLMRDCHAYLLLQLTGS